MGSRLGLTRSQLLLTFLLAIILVAVAYFQSQPQNGQPYDPNDTGSEGLRALVLWLEKLGYPVAVGMPRNGLPPAPGLLVISPNNPLNVAYVRDDGGESESESDNEGENEAENESSDALNQSDDEAYVEEIYQWVEAGGTLVLVGPTIPYEPLSVRFGVEQQEQFTNMVSDIRQVQPLLPDVPSEMNPFLSSHTLQFFTDPEYGVRSIVPLLSHASGDPAVALQVVGKGVVWHLSEDFAFSNLNLRDARIASLIPAILRSVPAGAPIVISTKHLVNFNEIAGEVTTLQDWLYTTPFGQATLLAMVACFAFLILQGRRLGPPLPGPSAQRPREAAEYVTALAGLQRRTRQPGAVADHHRQRLKSAVGRLGQIPADLPDDEWATQLRKSETVSPELLNQVTELLTGYAEFSTSAGGKRTKTADQTNNAMSGSTKYNNAGNKNPKNHDEADLIHLVQATDALVASLPRATMQLVR